MNLNYIDNHDLVTYVDKDNGVYSGGLNVNSVLMKMGISPIKTLNKHNPTNSEKVSDLFESLAIPNWVIAYKNLNGNSNYNEEPLGKNYYGGGIDDDEEEKEQDENDVIDDDLYNTLLGLVTVDKDGNDIIKGGASNKKKSRRLIKKLLNNKKTKKLKH